MPRPTFYKCIGTFLRRLDEKRYAYRKMLEDEYQYSLAFTKLVSSRGIRSTCTISNLNQPSSSVDFEYLNGIPEKVASAKDRSVCSIYVTSDEVNLFIDKVLPKINHRFFLVSGDSDLKINADSVPNINSLLSSNFLVCWHAQNLDYKHPKLHSLPIGLDYHTAWSNPNHYKSKYILPAHQESEIRQVIRTSAPFSQRRALAFCDWISNANYGDREDAKRNVVPEAIDFPKQRLTRHELWNLAAEYAFILSPFGIGMDCHRTWEALALGCVPIVKRSPLTPMFADFPVIVVEKWSNITPDFLRSMQAELNNQLFDYSSLFLNYWSDKINGIHNSSKCVCKIDDLRYVV